MLGLFPFNLKERIKIGFFRDLCFHWSTNFWNGIEQTDIFLLTNYSSSPEEPGKGRGERGPCSGESPVQPGFLLGGGTLLSPAPSHFSACSLCLAGGGVWLACRPLGDYEPQRRSRKVGGRQQGDVTARPCVVVDAAAVAAFRELCGVTPATALGPSDELDASAQLRGASHPQRDAWLEDLSHILLWRLDVIGYSCFFIESVSLREKEVGGQGSAPSQIVLLLEKALFAFGWSSLPSLHCSPKSPLPPTCPPRNPCLGAERWGLKDAAGHRDPSTCSQGFSGSRWSGIRHLRQETNHLTLGWLIILPSLFSIFSQQSLFAPTKNYFKKSHREV